LEYCPCCEKNRVRGYVSGSSNERNQTNNNVVFMICLDCNKCWCIKEEKYNQHIQDFYPDYKIPTSYVSYKCGCSYPKAQVKIKCPKHNENMVEIINKEICVFEYINVIISSLNYYNSLPQYEFYFVKQLSEQLCNEFFDTLLYVDDYAKKFYSEILNEYMKLMRFW
jgi:hypothetical protein